MSSDSPTLVEDDIAAKKSPSNGSPNSNGTAVSRNLVRRKGVRKSNSGGQVLSGPRQRGTERSKSDSSSTSGLTPRPNRKRVSKFSSSRGALDSSARSTGTVSSNDAESVGSYSLENDSSIDSKPLSDVKSVIARINKECTEQLDTKKSRPTPKRTGSRSSFGSRSSEKSERPVSPHSIGGSRSDQLDSQKNRIARRRSISRSSEVSDRDTPSPHSTRGSRTDPLDSQKGRSAYRRSGSRSSGLSEREAAMGESRLDNQKSRSAPKRTSSRSSDVSERETANTQSRVGESPRARGRKKASRSSEASDRGTTASPPSLAESPYLRGRKKPASLRSVTDSLTSQTFTSPLVSARSKSKRSLKTDDAASSVFSSPPVSVRSKSKKSMKTEDIADDSSQRAERRKTRSKSKSSGKNRSSSRKRTGEGENGRRYRRSRTPSKDEPLVDDDEADDSSIRRKNLPVSEDEIYQALKSAGGTPGEEAQRKAMRNKRLSKSPRRDQDDSRSLKKSNSDTMRRPRSNSSGNMEGRMEGRMRAMRRASVDVSDSNIERNREEKKTRNPPRRTRSNNIGVDKSALDSFFQNSSSVTGGRRKKTASSSRSVVSGSKSLNLSGAKTVTSTRSSKSRRRRVRDENGGKPLKPLSADGSQIAGNISGNSSFDEEEMFGASEYSTDDDDERSVDLDLATARDNFAQQNLNEKLQLHLTKTDELLYSVFPKHVADALRNGQKVAPENHDLVTIFFSDIVGFTDISAKLDPLKISDMLDRLYNSFDALSDYHDVFKVET